MEILMLTTVFISIVLLLLTPWFKSSSFLAVISLLGYFYYSSIDSWPPIILLITGIILIILEIFIPRFGLLGIIGFISTFFGLYYSTGEISKTITDLSIALLTSITLVIILVRSGYSYQKWNRFILSTQSKSQQISENPKQKVAISIGMVGMTTTPLRPSGKAIFNEDKTSYDVLSTEGHISENTEIVVQEVYGTKIIVRKK